MGTRQQIVEAYTAGRKAGRAHVHVNACPHPRTSILRRSWLRGYAEERPAEERPADDDQDHAE